MSRRGIYTHPPDVELIRGGISAGMNDLAMKRVELLFNGWCWHKGRDHYGDGPDLMMLLRSCYLQGAHDCATAAAYAALGGET